MAGPAITCPRCGRTSRHPLDVLERFCGACGMFHDDMAAIGHAAPARRDEPWPTGEEVATMIHLPEHVRSFIGRQMMATRLLQPKVLPGGRYAGLLRIRDRTAIVTGWIGDLGGYDDRWHYAQFGRAMDALAAWSGDGEPRNWEEHPGTGRRPAEAGGSVPNGRSPVRG